MKIMLIMIILTTLCCCDVESSSNSFSDTNMILINSYQLSVEEPSDICYDKNTNTLWTVSDNTNKVYNLDLEGNILAELPFTGNDLEGIAWSYLDNTLWLADEEDSQIINISITGQELNSYQLPLETGTNNGLEGICILPDSTIAVVKEKDPGMLFLLNSSLEIELEMIIDFAADFAAVSYNTEEECFWIVSDQDQAVYLWDLYRGIIAQYELPFDKPEGICYNSKNNSYYLVSDSQNTMYQMILQ